MDKTKNFIKKAIEKHGDRFDYSKTIFVNTTTKIKVICRKHGVYEQLPLNHLRQDCPKCAIEKEVERKRNNKEVFFSKLSKEKLEKYDYSLLEQFNYSFKGKFICKRHGIFKQTIKNHLESNGCPQCGKEISKNKNSRVEKHFNNILKNCPKIYELNVDKKDLPTNQSDKIKCKCKYHGIFYKSICELKKGYYCQKCRFKGYSKTEFVNFCKNRGKEKAIIYLIKIFDEKEVFYKIGITSNTIKERFRKLNFKTGYNYEIINFKEDKPSKIWDMENKNKKKLKKYRYSPDNYFEGYTECFTKDILDIYEF